MKWMSESEQRKLEEETKQEFISLMAEDGVYSVGVHKFLGEVEDLDSLASSILGKGLLTQRHENGGVPEIVYMKGSHDVIQKTSEMIDDLIAYVLDGQRGGTIISIPASLRGRDGNDYYLGLFPDDMDFIAKDDKRVMFLPISRLFNINGGLPAEFILGIIQRTKGEGISIVRNENYISNLPQEKQMELLESYFEKGMPKEQVRYSGNELIGKSPLLINPDRTRLSTQAIGKRTICAPIEDKSWISELLESLEDDERIELGEQDD